MLVLLFMGYIIVWALLNPHKVPPSDIAHVDSREKLYNSRRLIPVVMLIVGRDRLDLCRVCHADRGGRDRRARVAR